MATIKDVAKKAGVSISTVSIVINGKDKERKISQKTVQNVWNAIEELHYKPNKNALRLRSAPQSKT
ncbi:LacI family DNA-binding transcriptional regulator, partial [Dubosiella newyorkensis]